MGSRLISLNGEACITAINSAPVGDSLSLSWIVIAVNYWDSGGEGGIRTHGTREGSTVFETARFNRSRTSPRLFQVS